MKRAEAESTFVESHSRWQIRTFWLTVLWCVIGGALFITPVDIPIALAIFLAADTVGNLK